MDARNTDLETPFRPIDELLGTAPALPGPEGRRPGYASIVGADALAALGIQREADGRLGEFEILGTDDRRHVTDTTPIPFRFICVINMLFKSRVKPGNFVVLRGSGTLISDRHVLTAGHNVFDSLARYPEAVEAGLAVGRFRPNFIAAAPGQNGRQRPFGISPVVTARASPAWDATAAIQSDFALLTLRDSLGSAPHAALGGRPLGYWGHKALGGGTRIRPLTPATLARKAVNTSGYPRDKCGAAPTGRSATAAEMAACDILDKGSVQFRSFGSVTHSPAPGFPLMFGHDLDTADGQSGSPTWLRWRDFRNLVGVHRGGLPRDKPPRDVIASLDVRITENVLDRLRRWIRLDGLSPTF